jgi:Tol biopolymer transport system component
MRTLLHWRAAWLVVVAVPVLLTAGTAAAVPAQDGNRLVSISLTGTTGNGLSDIPQISTNGRYIAFVSLASDLVPGDTNGVRDAFLRDLRTNTTTRISVSSTGAQGNRLVFDDGLSISADGRYVTFVSLADNLVPGDTNQDWDVFVRDTRTNTTSRVSVSSTGEQGNVASGIFGASISADGRFVAFESVASNLVPGDAIGTADIFVRDRWAGTTIRVSVATDGTPGNNISTDPVISGNGRYVAFNSFSTNLVPNDTNGDYDVFLRDRFTNTTTRVNLSSTGEQANLRSLGGLALSADGRYVAFVSDATNLVPGDTNGVTDAFIRDRLTGTTTRTSVSSAGAQADRATTFLQSITPDGRFVVFFTDATNLVPDDTNDAWDIFRRDRWAGTTIRVSIGPNGEQGNGPSAPATVSGDGSLVTFGTRATNLVPGISDTNNTWDIIVHRIS